jgi:hypothetical protein
MNLHEKLSGEAVNSYWLIYGRFAARNLRMAQRFVHTAARCDDDCTHYCVYLTYVLSSRMRLIPDW